MLYWFNFKIDPEARIVRKNALEYIRFRLSKNCKERKGIKKLAQLR